MSPGCESHLVSQPDRASFASYYPLDPTESKRHLAACLTLHWDDVPMDTEGAPAAADSPAAPATEEPTVAAGAAEPSNEASTALPATSTAGGPEPEATEAAPDAAATAPEAAAATPTAAAPVPTAGDGAAEATAATVAAAAPLAAAASLFGSKGGLGGLGKKGGLSMLKDLGTKVVLVKKMSASASATSRTATVARFHAEMQACTPERFDGVPPADEETVRLLSEKMNLQIPKVIVDPAARGFFNLFRQMDHDGSGNIAFAEFAEMVRKELRLTQASPSPSPSPPPSPSPSLSPSSSFHPRPCRRVGRGGMAPRALPQALTLTLAGGHEHRRAHRLVEGHRC